jgi:ATP-dependent helicase HrpA
LTRFKPEQIAARRAALPRPEFPPELPVSGRREEIARAIAANPVVIVCGETGSGKTTQLPKICLALDRGVAGLIGHTQPRRIAARATAARIAQELHTELGEQVGFKVRFTDRTSPHGYIKLMTDGVLLAETQHDPELRQYDTLIIDEAHERNLNVDFLLGYLKQLLPRRPDLKLIVTSATIDAERFARHFDGAPVIEVSGRLYPVEVRYRPPQTDEDDEIDVQAAIVDAVAELSRLGPGDVLVFLPGEREIRETTEALRKHHPPHTEILPLYARLSVAEQQRVFKLHEGRRIVLATNVAETSLTVPGIRFVVDSGVARVKRYSYRNKVEQLQVEKISQAAARQRAGRCGRVAAGVCVRLYDEADFLARPAFTEPEILRSSLAAVILRMAALHLAAVESFPFIEAPAPKAIADGYALLQELGAMSESRELTELGSELAALPVDPRIGRMVLAATREGCVEEVVIIAAALSVQDPRDRPLERAQAADQAHKRFADERSDFMGFLKLWEFFHKAARHESQRKLHRLCHEQFLSFTRMREWQDVASQLREVLGELNGGDSPPGAARGRSVRPRSVRGGSVRGGSGGEGSGGEGSGGEGSAGDAAAAASGRAAADRFNPIHRALMSGLLGNLGLKTEEGGYLGARGIKFHIHPGSQLARKGPRWVMAAEMTETTRLLARCVAGVDAAWIEQVGGHLVKRHQAEPHWEKRQAQAVVLERGTLYGIPVYSGRRVSLAPIDPAHAREIFIREGLVAGDYESKAPFFQHNRRLIEDIEKLEHKSRRPDVLVDDDLIFAFYDRLIPPRVCTGADFEAWRREAEAGKPRLLFLERDELMRHEAAGITTAQFPPALEFAGRRFALDYEHDPGGPRDGVTLTVPLVALNQIPPARCEWLVPGLLKEKVQLLAKSIPQRTRHQLGPLAEFAQQFVGQQRDDRSKPLVDAIAAFARAEVGVAVNTDGFRPETLPAHLFMNFRVVDEHGRQLAMGRNLAQLRGELGAEAQRAFSAVAQEASAAAAAISTAPLPGQPLAGADEIATSWTFAPLEELMELHRGGQTLLGYPALVDRKDGVTLTVFDAPETARAEHRRGLLRLFAIALKDQIRFVERSLPGFQGLVLQFSDFGDSNELRAQLIAAAMERACMGDPLPRERAAFQRRVEDARGRFVLIAQELARLLGTILDAWRDARKRVQGIAKAFPEAARDIQAQLDRLLFKGFVSAVPYERVSQYPRYLKGVALRVDKLRADPERDSRQFAQLAPLETLWARELGRQRKSGTVDPQLDQFGWLLEELRVQLFAQELRTPVPVSAKRLERMWHTMNR